jgi:hypothetical protein
MRDTHCSTIDFGYTLAPSVRACFYIPRIQYGCFTTFLLDTGSDGTCLHGQLAYKIQNKMDEDNLDFAHGVGGLANEEKEWYYR